MSFDEVVNNHQWRRSTTMTDKPHEYLVLYKTIDKENFKYILNKIQTEGVDKPFYKTSFRYYEHGDYQYWRMDTIINRSLIKDHKNYI